VTSGLKELKLIGCRSNHKKDGTFHSTRQCAYISTGLRMGGVTPPLFHAPRYPAEGSA